MNKLKWPLMHKDVISGDQKIALCNFILNNHKYTQGAIVKEFETQWSQWLGCRYSVFVNSGSSANFIAYQAAKNLYPSKFDKGIISQATTWATTISPCLLDNGQIQLVDIALSDFSPGIEQLEYLIVKKGIKVLFLAHLLGFNALRKEIIDLCQEHGVILLEDCCEAHGATYNGTKVGNFGLGSTFSFYIGHHMTTIEGGMISTNDENFFQQCLLLRSHGLLRELPPQAQKKYHKTHKNFTFLTAGYNMRNTELHAFLGLEQLRELNNNIAVRKANFANFSSQIDPNLFYNQFKIEGNSSFCLPLICKNSRRENVEKLLKKLNIEFRPIIGGNLASHPFLKHHTNLVPLKNAAKVHRDGLYIGNNQYVDTNDILNLTNELHKAAWFGGKRKPKHQSARISKLIPVK